MQGIFINHLLISKSILKQLIIFNKNQKDHICNSSYHSF